MTKAMFLFSALLVGCSTFQQSQANGARGSQAGDNIDRKAQLKKAKAEQDQEARDRKLMLSKQNQLGTSGDYRQSMQSLPMASNRPGSLEIKPENVLASNFKKMPEGQLYAEIVDRYQAHDLFGFDLRSKTYLSRFSNSNRRDEVLYLRGLSSLSEKHYGEALAQFNRILRDHPNGKKAPSALFAKGIAFRRMNLSREAKLALTEVLHRYPGSPESLRAKAELKIIK